MASVINMLFSLLGSLIHGTLSVAVELVRSLCSRERKTEFDADFLPAGELLKTKETGFCLNGRAALSQHLSFQNAVVIGGTGNFKSSGILLPCIFRMGGHCSLVITDPSGELLAKSSGAVEADEIKVLNFNSRQTEGFNPLERTRTVPQIQKLAKMLVVHSLGTGGSDKFWNIAAEGLLSLCIRYIIEHTEQQYHSLYNVYHLVSALSFAPEKVDRLFVAAGNALLLSEYKSYVAYGERTLSSVIATCRSALTIFGTDPLVARATSFDTIDFSQFRRKKIVLYVNTSIPDMKYYAAATSILLAQFFAELMHSLPEKDAEPVFFLVDEASSLYINDLHIVCSNIRKARGGILQVYQSVSQIQDLYGAPLAKSIMENSFAKVYMGGQPIDVAKDISATLGSFEYMDEAGNRKVRALATPSEVHELSDALIACGHYRMIRSTITPYFRQPRLEALSRKAPYVPIDKCPFETPPMLPIL